MSKRVSGPPRRPRNPVAKAVRMPQYRQRVVPDKSRHLPKLEHRPGFEMEDETEVDEDRLDHKKPED